MATENTREHSEGHRNLTGGRPFHLLPPAMTPLTGRDIAAGLVGQIRGEGRAAFRREIASFLSGESAATYSSFKRALADCFRELKRETDRNTVLIPAFCSSDFKKSIEGVGLEIDRYDITTDTLSADVDSLASQLDSDTLAVVVVNVLGYGSPMDEIRNRSADEEVKIVEALGYALGSAYRNRPLGTFGDCAVINFQQGKPIPVGGGMVVSQDRSLEFSDVGRSPAEPNVTKLTGYAALSRPRPYYAYQGLKTVAEQVGFENIRPTTHPASKFGVDYEPPFLTMSNFQGTIGRRVFRRREADRRHRERSAHDYATAVASIPGVSSPKPHADLSKVQHVRFPLIAESEQLRDRLQPALEAIGVHATTLYDWPILDMETYPHAGRLQRQILTLPTHPGVDVTDRQRIVRAIEATVDAEPRR